MKLYALLAVAVAMVHAHPKPVRPLEGRGEVKVDSYLYRPDGQGVGYRGKGLGVGFRGGAQFSQMGGYDVQEMNGEGEIELPYAEQLRAGAAAAAGGAALNRASGFQFAQQNAFNSPATPVFQAGDVSQANQAFSQGIQNVVTTGGLGIGQIGGGLDHNCPEAHSVSLGGGNIQGSNAVNFAQGQPDVAGYSNKFVSSFGIGEQGYQINGLNQGSGTNEGSGNEGSSNFEALSSSYAGGHVGLQDSLGGAETQAAAAPIQGQIQNVHQYIPDQGNAAAQTVLGSGKLAINLGGADGTGVNRGASFSGVYGAPQVADGYTRYATNTDYSDQGRYTAQVGGDGYLSSNANRDFVAGNQGVSLQVGGANGYAGGDDSAQFNAYMSGLVNVGRMRYAGLAANIALGSANFNGGGNGISLGFAGHPVGAGVLVSGPNQNSINGATDSGVGFQYSQAENSASHLGQGTTSQIGAGVEGNSGHIAYGGVQTNAASVVGGVDSRQTFNLGYGEGREPISSSGQGNAVQGGYSVASENAVSTGGYSGLNAGGGPNVAQGGYAAELGSGELSRYGAGIVSNVGNVGGYHEQSIGNFQEGQRGAEPHSVGLEVAGEANYGSSSLAGYSSGQEQQGNFVGLEGSVSGKGGVSGVSFDAGAGVDHEENSRAESGGINSFGEAAGTQGGVSGASYGAIGSSVLLGSGGAGGHGGGAAVISTSYSNQIGAGHQQSGGSASGYSTNGGISSGVGYSAHDGGRASVDFSGLRYASGSGHATSFASQSSAHVQGLRVGSGVNHLVVSDGHGGHGDHYYGHPKYHFEYAVNDPHTGDIKNQWETRDGDVVKGAYSLHDPDGTIRTVEYESDKESGFHAVVKKQGKAVHPPPAH